MLDIEIANTVPEHEVGTIGFCTPSNLKELELTLPYITSSYIDLIAEQLPSTVNNFSFSMYHIGIFDWLDKVGIDKVIKLIERMSKVNHALLHCVSATIFDEVQHETDEESFITTFYKFIHAFKGNKKIFCTGTFNDSEDEHNIEIKNEELDFFYGFRFKGNYEINEDFGFAVPDKSASIVGLEIMNVLKFVIALRGGEESACKLLKYTLVKLSTSSACGVCG